MYRDLLRQQYTSVEQYITKSKIHSVGTWATEVEIHAAADFFEVDIYTYSQYKWLRFKSRSEKTENKGIYFKHCNECHYEPVTCVKDNVSSMCYSVNRLCENDHSKEKSDLFSVRKISNESQNKKKRQRYTEDSEYSQLKKNKKNTDMLVT